MIDLCYKNIKILQSSQNCNKCCTDSGLHDYSHGQVSLPILKRNLAQKRKNVFGELEILKKLKQLKNIVDNWLSKIDNYYKYEAVFGTDAQTVYDFELKATNENIHKMTCSQIYKLEQATHWKFSTSIKQTQKQFQKQITMDLQKYFKMFGKEAIENKLIQIHKQDITSIAQKIPVEKTNNQTSLKKISQDKPNSVNQLKQNPKPQQRFMDITPSQSDQSKKESKRDKLQQPKIPDQPISPSRKIQVENKGNKKEQIRNKQTNVVYRDPTLKIQQLKYESTDKFFQIIVKVIKIINNFDCKGVKFSRFVAGDDTGRCIFVTGSHPNIQQGKTIKITNCHLYIFQDKQKQIKATKHSKFELSPELPSINYKFDLSTFFETRQAELPIEYKKINDIQPEQEDLNMIVKIYQIIESKENSVKCYLGDETGIVKANLPSNSLIREGCSLRLLGMASAVVNEHVLIECRKNSKIIQDKTVFSVINIQNDISQQEWVEGNQ